MSGRLRFSDSRDLNLLRELTISQFKLKDQSTFFGLLWSLLNPLVMVGILFVFFATRFGEGVENYRIFLLLGMVQYTYFATATSTSMRSLVTMRQLTGGALFPKELLVVSSALASTVDFAIAMAACVALTYLTGTAPHWTHLLLLAVVLAEILLVTWVSLLLACAFAMARDLQHLYQVFLRALMFITPIFYSAESLGEGVAQYVIMLNPLAQLLAVSRSVLLHDQIPDAGSMVIITLTNLVMLVSSWFAFKLLEPRIVEYV
jgi:ABC-type polysaccharide/polyol phosphate export permease